MRRRWERLHDLVDGFSSYQARFLTQAEEAYGDLVSRLEGAGLRDDVHLWQRAWDTEKEMDIVAGVAGEREQRIRFLGCYYGMQYLRLNIQAVEALRAHVLPGTGRDDVYRVFIGSVGAAYRELIVVFIRKVADVLLADANAGRFALTAVGTLTHQDDVDVGVIVPDKGGREGLEPFLNDLNAVMTRYATRFHFYLSENASPGGLVTSLQDYRRYLDRTPGDFVVVSELMNAELLYGDDALLQELRRTAIDRYYAGRAGVYHEAFLRGAVGEARKLRERPYEPDRITPKEDGIRLINNLMQIRRSVHGLTFTDARAILDRLSDLEPGNAGHYAALDRGRTFFEVVRYLYQLLIVPDDVINLDSPGAKAQLGYVAETMGYERRGRAAPEESLLVHYYDHVDAVRQVTDAFLRAASRHLKAVTMFNDLADNRVTLGRSVRALSRMVQSSSRVSFWDDVFESLEERDGALSKELAGAFARLEPAKRSSRSRQIVAVLTRNPELAMRALVVLGRFRDQEGAAELYGIINRALLAGMAGSENPASEAAALFSAHPLLVRDYFYGAEYADVRRFIRCAEGGEAPPPLKPAAAALKRLGRARYYGSAYLSRYFLAATDAYPDILKELHNPEWLALKSSGLLAEAVSVADTAASRRLLEQYFNVGFSHVALQVLGGSSPEETNASYVEFADNFLAFLFDICREDLARRHKHWVTSSDILGIYATGGHARGWGFSEDFDLICVIDADDEDLVALGDALVGDLATQLRTVGITPHFRFLEHYGRLVVKLTELEGFLHDAGRGGFIEGAQLLESRQVVGTAALDAAVRARIIEPYVLEPAEGLITELTEEFAARREARGGVVPAGNIKEAIGGLADVALALTIVKARFHIRSSLIADVVEDASRIDPHAGLILRSLVNSMWYLKRLRDLYRLTVCQDDRIDFENAGVVAELLGFGPEEDPAAVGALKASFTRTTAKVAVDIEQLLKSLKGNKGE